MKFKLNKNSEIFIFAPANVDTGGPTDLHQLAYILKNKFKKKVYMHYLPSYSRTPVHKNYQIFKIPFKKKIIDIKKNILIIPETFHFINVSEKYKKIQKGLWWLSVDNYLKHRFVNKNNKIIKFLIKIPFKIIVLFNKLTLFRFGNLSFFKYLKFIYLKPPFINVFKIKNISINLAHSKYQFEALRLKKIKSFYLSDYIRDEYFKAAKNILITNKKNIVCYNPSKSSNFFNKFIKLNSDIKFLPLKNLSLEKMVSTLSKSKIYMDFGFHPGQDHLPREAAVLKNCVITNKEGSAAFYADLPIKNEFKFDEKSENFLRMRNKINIIFDNFTKELIKFEYYRKYLHQQKSQFEKQISRIFN